MGAHCALMAVNESHFVLGIRICAAKIAVLRWLDCLVEGQVSSMHNCYYKHNIEKTV